MRPILAALLLLTLPGTAFAQSTFAPVIDAAEQTMVRTVVAEHDRHIALLERMVNQNSGTLNLPGVRIVGDMVRAELEPLGFTVRWVDMADTGRAGHLIATHEGLSEAESHALNARLILILMNHIGDEAVLAEAITSPRGKRQFRRGVYDPATGGVTTSPLNKGIPMRNSISA